MTLVKFRFWFGLESPTTSVAMDLTLFMRDLKLEKGLLSSPFLFRSNFIIENTFIFLLNVFIASQVADII